MSGAIKKWKVVLGVSNLIDWGGDMIIAAAEKRHGDRYFARWAQFSQTRSDMMARPVFTSFSEVRLPTKDGGGEIEVGGPLFIDEV